MCFKTLGGLRTGEFPLSKVRINIQCTNAVTSIVLYESITHKRTRFSSLGAWSPIFMPLLSPYPKIYFQRFLFSKGRNNLRHRFLFFFFISPCINFRKFKFTQQIDVINFPQGG